MLWSRQLATILALALLGSSALLAADDSALWKEYGLVQQHTIHQGKITITAYQMKDLTGALAAWEWLRSAKSRACDLAPFCTIDGNRTIIFSDNYVLSFEGAVPSRDQVDAVIKDLPNKRDTSLPAILTFLPREGRVHDSARYVLGPESLARFAPELVSAKPGFEQGAEAQVASYQVDTQKGPARLAVFYYPTPEMARLHVPDFKLIVGPHVKRSGVLVALVLGSVSDETVDALLGRVGYEAKITWNESPQPSPVKPLYQLLVNILYMSGLLAALCLAAGLIYAAMRIYRRRYGTLESEEAMTVLHLTGSNPET